MGKSIADRPFLVNAALFAYTVVYMARVIYPLKLYVRHSAVLVLLVLSALVNVAIWLRILEIKPTEEFVFLHYTILFGVDLFGPWWRIFVLPVGGLLILLINAVIGWIFFHKDRVVAQLLLSVAAMCQIFLYIGATLLVFLNV